MLSSFEMVVMLKQVSLGIRADAETDAATRIQDLADAKDARKAELEELKEQNKQLQTEHEEESEGGIFGLNLDESILSPFARNAGDVAEDQQVNALSREKASMAVAEHQKEIGDVQETLKDIHDEYGWSQQMRDQMTEAITATQRAMFDI
jgi:hypothetical protein